MNGLVILTLIVALALAYWLGGRARTRGGSRGEYGSASGAGGRSSVGRGSRLASGGTSTRDCRWKLRAQARGDFPARWRCGRCSADVSVDGDGPPTVCYRVGRR